MVMNDWACRVRHPLLTLAAVIYLCGARADGQGQDASENVGQGGDPRANALEICG